jgi:hypothetical protein
MGCSVTPGVKKMARRASFIQYIVKAGLEGNPLRVCTIQALPQVLPSSSCPASGPSATLVIGWSAADMRARVQKELRGDTTCTHLNDELRALGDVSFLLHRYRIDDAET